MDRRKLLLSAAGAAFGAMTDRAGANPLNTIEKASMRGSIDASELGVRPGAFDDQSKAFSKMLKAASDKSTPIFMPPGTYVLSNIVLPDFVQLSGVPGATRLIYGGDGHFLTGEGMRHLSLAGLAIDGVNRWLGEDVTGLLSLSNCASVRIDDCDITGSSKNAVALEHCAGRIERCRISGAADAALYSVDGQGVDIASNTIADCANGGILVHRWSDGQDGSRVIGNRIARISARNGGTGQYGNGINLFRAAGVEVSGNAISDCAFSAIRANSASRARISGNEALRSGETAIYAEFAFEGAAVSDNIVDGAANGISVVNFNEGGRLATVSGNLVRNLSVDGPYTADSPGFGSGIIVEADTAVIGNVIENAPLWGIGIGWGPYLRNVTASSNVIRKAGTGIAVSVAEGAGAALLTGNVIEDAPGGGIAGFLWAEKSTGELAGQDGAKANVTVSGNRLS